MRKYCWGIFALVLILTGCNFKSEEQKHVDSEIARSRELLEKVLKQVDVLQENVTTEGIQELQDLCSNPKINVSPGVYDLNDEQKSRLARQQQIVDSIKTIAASMSGDIVDNCLKVLVADDPLVDGIKTYPFYLVKGSRLMIDYSVKGTAVARLYNVDSRSVLKTYKENVSDTIDIENNAIYLFEITTSEPQYCGVNIQQKVFSMDEFTAFHNIKVEQIEATSTSFRARKIPGIDLKPIFEEPHKYTIRNKMKFFFDPASPYRSVAALKVPAGTTDLLYHLRISTDDDGKASDGRFFDDVYTKYKKVKFLGLPLYETTTNRNGLFRELLSGISVQREEKAYCNLYVFTNEAQAKKFLNNAEMKDITYSLDYSAQGTQSRNERIPVKGTQTVYLGFENVRETHDIYLWVEALAAIPKDLYYTESYSLE